MSDADMNLAARVNGSIASKNRTGRVQLGIQRAFLIHPDREWTTRELMK
jgi:hypothetical protein